MHVSTSGYNLVTARSPLDGGATPNSRVTLALKTHKTLASTLGRQSFGYTDLVF